MTKQESQPETELSLAIAATMDSIEASLDRIAGHAMGEIVTEISAYAERNSQILREQVLANARDSLSLFINLVREDRAAEPGDFGFVTQRVTGPLRVGIGVESVLHAYRIGHRATWDAIVELTSRLPNGSEVSVALSRPAMEFIDSISKAVTLAFIEENQLLESEAAGETRDMIEAMISGGLPAPKTRAGARAIESMTGPAGFVSLRAKLEGDADLGSIKRLAENLNHRTVARDGLITVRQGELVAFLPLLSGTAREVADLLIDAAPQFAVAAGSPVRLGLSLECLGLFEAARGYEEAGDAMKMASEIRPVVALPLSSTFEQLLNRTDETLRRQAGSSLGDLGRMSGPGADELRRTILIYAEAGMNARGAAKILVCRPNTVHHRLARIKEVSGLDPTRFPELVDLVSALRIRAR